MRKCKFRECGNDEDYAILGVCKTCYSGLAYWKGRSQAHKRKRAKQLVKLSDRMDHLIDYPRSVPRKRKRR